VSESTACRRSVMGIRGRPPLSIAGREVRASNPLGEARAAGRGQSLTLLGLLLPALLRHVASGNASDYFRTRTPPLTGATASCNSRKRSARRAGEPLFHPFRRPRPALCTKLGLVSRPTPGWLHLLGPVHRGPGRRSRCLTPTNQPGDRPDHDSGFREAFSAGTTSPLRGLRLRGRSCRSAGVSRGPHVLRTPRVSLEVSPRPGAGVEGDSLTGLGRHRPKAWRGSIP
jgi:hypothetical protein